MREINVKAYAKLNLSLDVARRREDGYHDMVMIMQTVSLCDDISLALNNTGEIRAQTNLSFIPRDERNLAVRAASAFYEAMGVSAPGLEINIKKNIPVGAGMGGGSADAAAVLRALNSLYDGRFSLHELENIAAAVGSDVTFCIAGGTRLATGRGEILSPLPDMPDCSIVICKPEFSVSTPELFKKIDRMKLRHHPDTAGIVDAVSRGDLKGICRRMYNVFEDVDDRRMKTVAAIKSSLLDAGALGAVMTGTGSAVFGIFDDAKRAEKSCAELGREYSFTCTAKPVPAVG